MFLKFQMINAKVFEVIIKNLNICNPMNFFKIIKMFAKIFAVWPINANNKFWQIYLYQFIWWFATLNNAFTIIPLFISVCVYRRNKIPFFFALMELMVALETFITFVNCRYQQDKLKKLFSVTEKSMFYIKNKRPNILKSSSNDVFKLHSIMMGVCMLAQGLYTYKALQHQNLPGSAWYPFSTAYQPMNLIVRLHQLCVIYSGLIITIVDGLCFFLLYYIAIVMELLKEDYKQVRSNAQMKICARSHQEILRFLENVNESFKYIFAKLMVNYFGYFIASSFIVQREGISTIGSKLFICVLIEAVLRLYVYALCSERVIEKHAQLNYIMFETLWDQRSRKSFHSFIIVMQRCQKPLRILPNRVISSVNKKFFLEMFEMAISYFMALRAIQKKSDTS